MDCGANFVPSDLLLVKGGGGCELYIHTAPSWQQCLLTPQLIRKQTFQVQLSIRTHDITGSFSVSIYSFSWIMKSYRRILNSI